MHLVENLFKIVTGLFHRVRVYSFISGDNNAFIS